MFRHWGNQKIIDFHLELSPSSADNIGMHQHSSISWLDTVAEAIDFVAADTDTTTLHALNWMRHSVVMGKLWTPPDVDEICERYLGSCGLLAFAAVTGTSASKAIQMFPKSEEKQWINRKEMCAAIQQLGFSYERKGSDQWPQVGLSLIHFTGPWTVAGYPARMLQNCHWIGVVGEYIFDVNWLGWLPRTNWSDIVIEQLILSKPNVDGWSLLSSFDLSRSL